MPDTYPSAVLTEWRLTHPPIMGGAPDGDDDADTGDTGGGTAVEDRPDAAGDIIGIPRSEPAPEEEDSPEPGSDAEVLGRLKAENSRLKREAAAREKEKRRAELEAKRRADEVKAEQGQWRELAQEREREIESLKAQIAERDQRDQQREMRARVEAVADKLNFRRPKRAYPLLIDELSQEEAEETLGDAQLIEAALKRMVRDDATLVDSQRRSGAPVGRNGQPAASPQQGLNQLLADLAGGGRR